MNAQPVAAPRILSNIEFTLLKSRPVTRILFICVPFAITGIVQGFWHGWDFNALALIAGALFAVLGAMMYDGAIGAPKGPAWIPGQAVLGFFPYLFGCYLVFIRGMWNGRDTLVDFSIGRLFATIAFVYLGYRIVHWTHVLSEIGESLRTGKLVLSGEAGDVSQAAFVKH